MNKRIEQNMKVREDIKVKLGGATWNGSSKDRESIREPDWIYWHNCMDWTAE